MGGERGNRTWYLHSAPFIFGKKWGHHQNNLYCNKKGTGKERQHRKAAKVNVSTRIVQNHSFAFSITAGVPSSLPHINLAHGVLAIALMELACRLCPPVPSLICLLLSNSVQDKRRVHRAVKKPQKNFFYYLRELQKGAIRCGEFYSIE